MSQYKRKKEIVKTIKTNMKRNKNRKNTKGWEKRSSFITDQSPRRRLHCCPDQLGTNCKIRQASPSDSLWMAFDVLACPYIGKMTPWPLPTEHHRHLELTGKHSWMLSGRCPSSLSGKRSWMLWECYQLSTIGVLRKIPHPRHYRQLAGKRILLDRTV